MFIQNIKNVSGEMGFAIKALFNKVLPVLVETRGREVYTIK